MRGDGTRSFPQENRLAVGGKQIAVRIDGEIGKLKLLVQTSDKQRTTPFLLRAAVPVLPVPGSLRVSPDGRSGAAKGPKIVIQKYKRRKGYSKKIGHRQKYTAVKVTGINV